LRPPVAAGGDNIADLGLRILPNKPNSRAEPLPLAPRLASLTPGGSDYAKQTQTWASWDTWRTGRRGRTQGKCAKQTQFGPRQGEGQVPCRKGFMVNRPGNRLRQNKANLRARPRTGVGRGATGGAVAQAYCAKQSQFFDCGSCHCEPVRLRSGQAARGNPDCGLGTDWRRDAYRATCFPEPVAQTNPIPDQGCRAKRRECASGRGGKPLACKG
jgi:hypothetical protein